MENQTNVGNQNTNRSAKILLANLLLFPKSKKTSYLMIAGIILVCFVIFGFGGYYLGRQTSNNSGQSSLPQSYRSPTTTASSPTPKNLAQPPTAPHKTAGWDTYSNTSAGFSVKHPAGWRKVETENWVGFGPKEIGEDVLMGVSI